MIKVELKQYGRDALAGIKNLKIVPENHTGKVIIELNSNEGNLTSIVVKPEIKA